MKALSVFSGGLDSMLAAEIIRAQGIEVLALFFETPFFSSGKARESAATIDLPLKVIDITKRHLEVVKTPRHGHGGNMNPCIDCHALMIRCAGELLEKEEAQFIITGEVLGQRPMSQTRGSLVVVARDSGFDGLLLRPLSAKCLPVTIPEEKGWVDRGRLLDWSGRSRKPQIAHAEQLGIKKYPAPAGGCLLTDIVFSRRLRDLFNNRPDAETREIELLKIGRHFRIGPRTKLTVGRNKKENQAIQALAKPEDLIFQTTTVPGPTTLVVGDVSPEMATLVASITVSYSDEGNNQDVEMRVTGKEGEKTVQAKGRDKSEFKHYMI